MCTNKISYTEMLETRIWGHEERHCGFSHGEDIFNSDIAKWVLDLVDEALDNIDAAKFVHGNIAKLDICSCKLEEMLDGFCIRDMYSKYEENSGDEEWYSLITILDREALERSVESSALATGAL